MTKVQANNKIYIYKVSSKPNVDIIGTTVSMWKQHLFKIIFTYYFILNIQDNIGKGFRSRETLLKIGVNDYFVTRRANITQ